MWTAEIFAGAVFAGVIFLLYFLVQLFREHPFRVQRAGQILSRERATLRPLRLRSDWAAVKREENLVTLHSIWHYAANVSEIEKREPSCGISSSY